MFNRTPVHEIPDSPLNGKIFYTLKGEVGKQSIQ